MSTYVAIWPITDPTNLNQLTDQASPLLADMLEDAGLTPVGPTAWTLTGARLVAQVPVLAEHAAAGDMRPWTSIEARAAELYDREAA